MRRKPPVNNRQSGIQSCGQRGTGQRVQTRNDSGINFRFGFHDMDQRTIGIIDCQHIQNAAFDKSIIEFRQGAVDLAPVFSLDSGDGTS